MWFLKPVKRQEFKGSKSFDELREFIQRYQKSTRLVRIESPADCNIVPASGTTLTGLRFNMLAFQQLCGLLGSGLYGFMAELWTESPQPRELKQHRLLQVYRIALETLGKRLVGSRLVVDDADNEIVGVVGRKYKFVSNLELIQSANRYFAEAGNFRAVRASMSNRDMLLVGVKRGETLRSAEVEFTQGVAIYNSETTRQAVFSPQLVFDSQSRTYAMQTQTPGNRLIHRQRKNFQILLDELIQGAFRHESILDMVMAGYTKLKSAKLLSQENRAVGLQRLGKHLRDQEIGARSVDVVLDSFKGLQSVTKWDLYRGMLVAANKTTLSDRMLRVVAYKLLTKR